MKKVMFIRADWFAFLFIGVCSFLHYYVLNLIDLSYLLEYWTFAPNAYRVTHQLVIALGGNVYFNLSLLFGISMLLTYWILQPYGDMRDYFLFSVFLLGAFGLGLNPLMYPILAWIGKNPDSPFVYTAVVSLILVKEIAFFIGWFYVLFQHHKGSELGVVLSGVGGFTGYALIVRAIGVLPYHNSTAPFFTPVWVFFHLSWSRLFMIGVIAVFLYLVIRDDVGFMMWAITVVPILLFAQVWEFQLWVPLVILLLGWYDKGFWLEYDDL